MKKHDPSERDHDLEDLDDFGKVRFDPDNIADTREELAELDTERFYQPRDDKPSIKRAPGGQGNPERPNGKNRK